VSLVKWSEHCFPRGWRNQTSAAALERETERERRRLCVLRGYLICGERFQRNVKAMLFENECDFSEILPTSTAPVLCVWSICRVDAGSG
jgi:hypothetical protein